MADSDEVTVGEFMPVLKRHGELDYAGYRWEYVGEYALTDDDIKSLNPED